MSRRAKPLVLSVFATFKVGGPQVRFAAVANHYGSNFRHAIVAMDSRLDCLERLDPALDVVVINPPPRRVALVAKLAGIRRTIGKLQPDVLVTHNWGSIEWVLANRLPGGVRHIHIEDGFGPEERSRQIPRRVFVRSLLLRRSTVVLPSHTLLKIALDVWRLPLRQVRHVPNGLDLARFRPSDGVASTTSRSGPPVIGVVAALRPEKNIGRLLRAVRLLRERGADFRLSIVGDGAERPGLEALSRELGLADIVDFKGSLADTAGAYRDFDVFALSSQTEQMPLSILEAMASGLPIAAMAVGDVPQMLAEENRRFLAEQSDDDLARVLLPLLISGPLRRELGAVNRAKAERDFDELAMFKAYGALLEPPGPQRFG